MATLYKADGSIEDVTVNGLDDLQKHVGGNIEVVPGMEKNINDKHYLYLVNEEGIIEGLPGNKTYPGLYGNVLMVEFGKEFE